MNTITSKNVEDSSDTNCSKKTGERNRKYETTHPKQRTSRLPCKVSPVCDIVEQSKENTLKLLSLKREKKQKEDIEQGKHF